MFFKANFYLKNKIILNKYKKKNLPKDKFLHKKTTKHFIK